ncbi:MULTISPECIES: ATP phosphoribosyltransferase [Trueperella]|uniref:ATP phosphoribosyltransferase n=1 Tax=Trueperella bernardiae TaxID=59561 RepID=A0AAW6ZKB9_9ACTO|nr:MULTISPECIES: ATP phosphoribosyltransferase [Trueperella]MCM3906595.1 ATP phosphoribosyltransferase [Trueperella bernardiae]MDK8601098.1 ATP phosphoribosyltransferase [Trueperella bernardiae]MDV6237930.1 ATP phosphoribosyltransferase [Trueperella bernardiae]OCW60939.1 ATP phosphoribosyltransferase [Trueperella bernardiae]OFS68580.1 ATP phosphoribosyltransferase [Trueperella sp. HMSC08H06]
MLRIAVPNKGSLSEPASRMLAEAGYRQRRESRELVLVDEDNDVEFFYIRPRDVAVYVGAGTVDVGITGRDLLVDSQANAIEHRGLGFARATFRFAAPGGEHITIADLAGKRIATSYDSLVSSYLADRGIEASVVHLDGAVESSVRLGIADAIADVVETGSTLRAAGMSVFGDPLLRSEAILIRNADQEVGHDLEILDGRLEGVIMARNYVLMDYDIQRDRLERAVMLTPGYQSPTVSPLHDEDWVAVRAMVERKKMNAVMDDLHDVGARGILVTPILTSRI